MTLRSRLNLWGSIKAYCSLTCSSYYRWFYRIRYARSTYLKLISNNKSFNQIQNSPCYRYAMLFGTTDINGLNWLSTGSYIQVLHTLGSQTNNFSLKDWILVSLEMPCTLIFVAFRAHPLKTLRICNQLLLTKLLASSRVLMLLKKHCRPASRPQNWNVNGSWPRTLRQRHLALHGKLSQWGSYLLATLQTVLKLQGKWLLEDLLLFAQYQSDHLGPSNSSNLPAINVATHSIYNNLNRFLCASTTSWYNKMVRCTQSQYVCYHYESAKQYGYYLFCDVFFSNYILMCSKNKSDLYIVKNRSWRFTTCFLLTSVIIYVR